MSYPASQARCRVQSPTGLLPSASLPMPSASLPMPGFGSASATLPGFNPLLAQALSPQGATGESQQLVDQTNHLKSLLGL